MNFKEREKKMNKRETTHLTNVELTPANSFVEILYLGEGAVRANVRLRNSENTLVTTMSFWKGSIEQSQKAARSFYRTFLR